jgi:hypothetical protein
MSKDSQKFVRILDISNFTLSCSKWADVSSQNNLTLYFAKQSSEQNLLSSMLLMADKTGAGMAREEADPF